ncbi:DUF7504 family protein [Halobellus sp. GM3]|uniref:DUF7504 family protein n=1 Tax=Halobellus sp. GM3 TaxID=3458410 RepID=UPI00403D8798
MRDEEEESSAADDEPSSSLSDLADRIKAGAPRADESTDADADAGDSEENTPLSQLADSLQGRRTDEEALGDEEADAGEWDFVRGETAGGAAALDPKTEAVLELIGDASNVLISGPGDSPSEEGLCSRLMASRTDEPVNLLVITITETPSQRLSVLENYLDGPVGETAVIDVRNYNRESNYDQYDGPVDIRTVTNAQDLRRIGIITSKQLTKWEEKPGETTVCFHSLSDLLSLTGDRQRVFRFLHVLRGRVQAAGARAHYHLDPEQHPDESVRSFESLFDTVITFDEDGSVSLL